MDDLRILKNIGLIFLVVFLGVSGVNLAFKSIYSEQLSMNSCDLCYKLNPNLNDCINYSGIEQINLSYRPLISYGK